MIILYYFNNIRSLAYMIVKVVYNTPVYLPLNGYCYTGLKSCFNPVFYMIENVASLTETYVNIQ